jgi:formate dehydrogenase major subunit
MPMNSTESPVNRLTGSYTDRVTHTPAYKETSVHMRVLPEVGQNPLPRINHRFGQPTPQRGAEVERKWQRPDYRIPGTPMVFRATKNKLSLGSPSSGGEDREEAVSLSITVNSKL